MANGELFNYIKQGLKEGYDEEKIKNKLISAGWQNKDVEEAFSIISNSTSSTYSSSSSAQETPSFSPDEQKVNEVFEKAGFGIRLVAYLIDSAIIFLISLLIGVLIGFGNLALNIGELLAYILFILYTIGMWSFAGGATIGKKIMGIKIVTVSGSPIGLGRAILRLIGYFVSGLFLGLGYLWIIWDKKKQGFHDKIAGTITIRT